MGQRATVWFKIQFKTKCAMCQEKLLAGDTACYDAEKNILCEPCGEEEDE